MSSVKVAVRVRPFNDREKNMNAQLCISMEGKATTIDNAEDPKGGKKTFSFDYSYWSHDGFENDETGYSRPISSKYADQQRLYNEIGKDVLNNAYEGYNACLFAYGQTGAGKSYSMVGYGANKGIIVRACEEIFARIGANTDPTLQAQVQISMLEIYNEQVQDLLMPIEKRPKGGLKIRHTPQLGTFVQDLTKCPVDSYAAIQAKLDEGTANRTVGATLMNATSSRAHTVLQINFRQITIDAGTGEPVSQKSSEISLVDLAGSERAGSTGATGDRLKEGCAINQSLSALGNVISALADKAAGKLKPGQVVPYRDSALTRILQTALGGNSKTCMIAALSPATVNYEETLSTLRYADRVKQIKNEATVNENPLEKLIRELREENERLKTAMGGALPDAVPGGGADPQMEELRRQYEEELEANRKALQEMTMSWQDKLEAAKKRRPTSVEVRDTDQLTIPYLSNLNEDPLLSGKIVFPLTEGSSTIGKPGGNTEPKFHIGGLGVSPLHAVVDVRHAQQDGDGSGATVYEVMLTAHGKTCINGLVLGNNESKVLGHKDRIIFGHNNMFVFVDPTDEDKTLPSWEEGMREVTKDVIDECATQQTPQANLAELKYQEKVEKLQTDMQIFESEKKELLRRIKDKEALVLASEEDQAEAERKLKLVAAEKRAVLQELDRKEDELKARRLLLEREKNEEARRQDAERAAQVFLHEVMSRTALLVEEANGYAQELGVGVYFSLKLNTKTRSTGGLRSTLIGTSLQQTEIVIRVQRVDSDVVQLWNLDLFERKVFEMRELYTQWAAGSRAESYLKEGVTDPFALDLDSYQVIGESYLYLDTIRFLLPIESEVFPIIDANGKVCGKLTLSVSIEVASNTDDPDCQGRIEQEVNIDALHSVVDIKGREMILTITVHSAHDLPEKLCKHPQASGEPLLRVNNKEGFRNSTSEFEKWTFGAQGR
ncbi:Protein CBR-KLP-6, related [Eimeria maxima]|uniref:Kinesin-like protein n=1 Tax=Eimeria maxima TaxID=5804 RepID=U6MJH7_EIMMA|nr:Protein CBR-KLP-6, related [Eimeria maxima]CDJ61810.1 Protein CBR-KLP-6, related [Eimeria maxima]